MTTSDKKRSRKPVGALTVILLCLVGSGIVRFGGIEGAIAKESQHATPEQQQDAPRTEVCETEDDIGHLLEAIKNRQSLLDQREARLANRIQALNVAEMKLKENIATLIEAEKQLAATLTIADSAAEDDIKRLTSVYENMKPKNAAGLFKAMAPEFAAGFLARMRPDSAAQIMSNLPAEKAYTISLVLAGRNARAPVN